MQSKSPVLLMLFRDLMEFVVYWATDSFLFYSWIDRPIKLPKMLLSKKKKFGFNHYYGDVYRYRRSHFLTDEGCKRIRQWSVVIEDSRYAAQEHQISFSNLVCPYEAGFGILDDKFRVNVKATLSDWINENCNGFYYIGWENVHFQKKSDATKFILRWADSK